MRDYIDVRDLAEAHVLVSRDLRPAEVASYFNVSSGKPYSVLQVVDEIIKVTSSKSEIALNDRANGDPAAVWSQLDQDLISLGWSPKVSLTESIQSHVDNYKLLFEGKRNGF